MANIPRPSHLVHGRTLTGINVPIQVDDNGVVATSGGGGGGGGTGDASAANQVTEQGYIGPTTAVAVAGDNNGSLSAKIRNINIAVTDVYDSSLHLLKVGIQNSTLTVTQSGTWSSRTQDGSGNAITSHSSALDVSIRSQAAAITVDGSAVTQPISAVALPLPSGAATAVKQPALGTSGTPSVDVLTVQGAASMTKLLVTPDSVALPANQSVNVSQVAGTTPDTNSGVKSTGTLRVVLATDQPALTNKLLVTPDSVALPANQSVNVNQLAGTTADTNSGTKSAGTLRVVLATDQPALTNKLLVTPDSVALPANQSVNINQIAGATPPLGHGTAATALRVELPTDGTGVVGLVAGTASVGKISDITTSVVPGTGATNLGKAEDAAHTTGDTGVMSLAVRETTLTDLSAGNTDGDYEPLQVNKTGALWVTGSPSGTSGWSIATGSIGATKTDIGTANTPGQVGGWYVFNPNTSAIYVQFFNAQASAVTLGTTAPVYSLGVPAGAAANIPPTLVGLQHATAISIAITTTRAGLTGPSSTVDFNIWFKQ